MKVKNIINQRFGKLVAIAPVGKANGRILWWLQCDCGNTDTAIVSVLLNGQKKSCGCLKVDTLIARNKTIKQRQAVINNNLKHGHAASKRDLTYNTWRAMKERCTNPDNKCYYLYGEQGISFDKRWLDFKHFLEDMGERPKGMTLDRINPYGNYTRNNCRWATIKEQAQNKRKRKIKLY